MHPSVEEKLQFFEYGHLPSGRLRTISAKCHDLAHEMAENWQLEGPQLTVGLQHLLEAKDCFVRAGLAAEKKQD